MKKLAKRIAALAMTAAMMTASAGAITQDGQSETWFDGVWALIDAFGLKAEHDPYVLQNYINKYLEKHPDIVHIALAFEFQVFPEVPFEAHDILPQMLVTEKRIIRPEENSERTLEEIGRRAKAAEPVLRIMGTTKKNEVLLHVADALIKEQNYILGKNAKDVEIAKKNGMEPGWWIV